MYLPEFAIRWLHSETSFGANSFQYFWRILTPASRWSISSPRRNVSDVCMEFRVIFPSFERLNLSHVSIGLIFEKKSTKLELRTRQASEWRRNSSSLYARAENVLSQPRRGAPFSENPQGREWRSAFIGAWPIVSN